MCGRKAFKSVPLLKYFARNVEIAITWLMCESFFVDCTFYHFHPSCTVIQYKRPYTIPKLYKQHHRVVNDKAVCSGGPSFKFESGNRKYWDIFEVVQFVHLGSQYLLQYHTHMTTDITLTSWCHKYRSSNSITPTCFAVNMPASESTCTKLKTSCNWKKYVINVLTHSVLHLQMIK